MKRKPSIILIAASAGLIAMLLVYIFVYNKPHKDYASADAEYVLTPAELFDEYNFNYDEAVSKYNGKVIAVKGVPDTFEVVGELVIAVFHLDEGIFGPRGVRCTFIEGISAADFAEGEILTIKGYCTGYNEEDVILEHCQVI